jgi:hypothetical protein
LLVNESLFIESGSCAAAHELSSFRLARAVTSSTSER